MRGNQKKQRGFSLVTAIFLLVVLAILGTYMSALSISQHQSSALSVQGVRAWYATVSGLEWASDYIFDPALGNSNCPVIPSSMSIEGFTVKVTACTKTTHTEAGHSYNIFDVSVTAERGSYGEVDYVQRSLRATIGGP
jgi:MSHA biogenesis protein MshP